MNSMELLHYFFGISLHIVALIWLPVLPVKTASEREIQKYMIPLMWGFLMNFLLGFLKQLLKPLPFTDMLVIDVTVVIIQQLSIYVIVKYLYRVLFLYIKRDFRQWIEILNTVLLAAAGLFAITFSIISSIWPQTVAGFMELIVDFSKLLIIGVYLTALGTGLCILIFQSNKKKTEGYFSITLGSGLFLLCLVLKTLYPSNPILKFSLDMGSIVFFFFPVFFIFWKKTRTAEFLDNQVLNILSKREKEVARLLVKGLSNKDIGDNLFISVDTVKKHASNIYQKMGLRNRTELAVVFQEKAKQNPAGTKV